MEVMLGYLSTGPLGLLLGLLVTLAMGVGLLYLVYVLVKAIKKTVTPSTRQSLSKATTPKKSKSAMPI